MAAAPPSDGGGATKPGSSGISAGVPTSFAPCLSILWHPRDSGARIEPGSANTSRPIPFARRAVMSDPARIAAPAISNSTDQPCDPAVARREARGARRCAGRPFRDHCPPGRDLPREQWMSGRVDGAGAGADHRDRAAAAGQRATMRRPVDARCRAVTQPPARLATVRARTARRPPRPAAWHYGCRPPRRAWHATVRASILYRAARVDRASSARQADRPGRRA